MAALNVFWTLAQKTFPVLARKLGLTIVKSDMPRLSASDTCSIRAMDQVSEEAKMRSVAKIRQDS